MDDTLSHLENLRLDAGPSPPWSPERKPHSLRSPYPSPSPAPTYRPLTAPTSTAATYGSTSSTSTIGTPPHPLLLLLRLPHDITPTTLLSSIRNIDKIRTLTITRKPGSHPSANLQFFTHAANSRFYTSTRQGLTIAGHRVLVIWSRKLADKEYPVNEITRDHSRVMRITGRKEVVDLRVIKEILERREGYLHPEVSCEVENVDEISVGLREEEVGYEIRFVAFAPDTQIAWMVLERELEGRGVVMGWGSDPCA
ncbi:hypothetical protein B0T14DRAFT_593804 [Immersiella caudata]|uniref:Uncharacterized protein n=1 Tax=Immersiella caudata TaxID=314043 RepID=A0AA39TXB6_9PEZI|nr:hypothetical protein B0T14DRAFT_593804 [Immersiella caudata]